MDRGREGRGGVEDGGGREGRIVGGKGGEKEGGRQGGREGGWEGGREEEYRDIRPGRKRQ